MKRSTLIVLLSFLWLNAQSQETDSIAANNYTYQELTKLLQFPKLRYLKIYAYNDSVLPEIFDQLPHLEYLEINDTKIKAIPVSIGKLSKLKTLIVCNGMSAITIPAEIGQLTQLTKLQLYNHHFATVPNEIGNLINLESLMLCGELTNLPASVANWKKLKSLYLGGNEFSEIPSPIFRLTHLKSLNLGNNKLTNLSDSIRFLTELEELTISNNIEIDQLPPQFCDLKKLKSLFIQNTKISSLPSCLNELQSLGRIRLCKTVIDDPAAMEAVFKQKLDWDWMCHGLESHLVDFSEIYGTYTLKLQHKKDTVILHYGYFYDEPGTIDEEFSQTITIKILEKDHIRLNQIYSASNPHFIISNNHFSIWDWSTPQDQKITGYLHFTKISKKEYRVYLNLDLIENGRRTKLVDKLLTFQ